jgi:phage shock protein E
MNWNYILIIAGIVAAGFVLKRLGCISADAARKHLKEGALVVDVRSPGEFKSQSLPGAVNIPLGDLADRAPRLLPDKDRVLLLHCLSGTRSGMAKRQLQSLGYRRVFNLGSFGRARRIVESQR